MKLTEEYCLSLVGTAGAGKSTIGEIVAKQLNWAHLDTDRLIESYYGMSLQEVYDCLSYEDFVLAEERIVASMAMKRAVISTGGSVIYGPNAVAQLKRLGPVVFVDVGFDEMCKRIGSHCDRGLALRPGQTLEDLYNMRKPLYEQAADFIVSTDCETPEECVDKIMHWLKEES